MEFLFLVLILGIIPAMIANNKGRSFIGWYIYGVFLFIIALVHSLLINSNRQVVEHNQMADGTMKKCEFCAELIKSEAKVCRYCGKDC
tara:strand:+ start:109 stop:372 length:264 start_codon:yes stop_codon:yes gene_type:complete